MPHDANAAFDQTVLDLIEHSPIGAVPHTPAYQDALRRLYASHQVYANADHKGGHITARSLTGRPTFHPSNLDALIAGEIVADALEANNTIYDRYVQWLPVEQRARAEGFRRLVAGKPILHRNKHAGNGDNPIHDPVHALFLVPGGGLHPGLPGNYLYGFALETIRKGQPTLWSVHVHDAEDGDVIFAAADAREAFAVMRDVVSSAPFNMDELEALGFRST